MTGRANDRLQMSVIAGIFTGRLFSHINLANLLECSGFIFFFLQGSVSRLCQKPGGPKQEIMRMFQPRQRVVSVHIVRSLGAAAQSFCSKIIIFELCKLTNRLSSKSLDKTASEF